MADPRAVVPYHDPHDDGAEYVNNMLCFDHNPNPTINDINTVSVTFASPNPVPQPSGGTGVVDANPTLSNPGLSNTMARNDLPASSRCRGGTSAGREDLVTENSILDPRPPFVVPDHSIPHFCDCCYVLRTINHTNGYHGVRLEIHGGIGRLCHAILENTYGGNGQPAVRQHRMIDLKHKSMEEVKTFLLQFLEQHKQAGYELMSDPLTIFYDTLCVGMQFHETTNHVTRPSNNHGSGPSGSRPSNAGNLDPGFSNQGPSGSVQSGLGPSGHFGAGPSGAGSSGPEPSGSGSSGQGRPGAGLHICGNSVPGPSGAGPRILNNLISGLSGPGNSGEGASNLRRSHRITLISKPSSSSISVPGPSGSGHLGSGPSAAQPPNLGPSAQPSNSGLSGSGPLDSRPTKSQHTRGDDVNQQEAHAASQARQNANQANMPRRRGRRPRNVAVDAPGNDVNQQEPPAEPQVGQNANQMNVPRPPGRRPRNDAERSFLSIQRERVLNMTLRDVQPYFDVPIKTAAQRLQLCVTVIKKICRNNNVERWPYRKIQATKNKIDKLRSEMSTYSSSGRAHARSRIAQLERDLIAARDGRNIP